MKTKHAYWNLALGAKAALLRVILIGLIGAAPVALQAATLSELLEQGVYSEETKGDLDEAIRAYRRIVEEAKAGQPLAGQAQYRLGICHYKKGQYSEARAAFEALIRDYPDQKELVRLAREYLAGAVALLPAPWTDGEVMQLDLKLPTGFKLGFLRYLVHSDSLGNRQIWRLGSVLVAGPKQVSRVEVEADSFKPIHSRWRHSLLGDADTAYSPGHAEVTLHHKDEVKTVDVDGPCYDNEEVMHLVRRLPLAPGYTTTLSVFTSLGGTRIIPIEINVVGLETIKVPAGTFECYKTTLSLVDQTLWLSADARRYLVKFDAGGFVAELTGVEENPGGNLAVVEDAAFDFPLGKAGGGVPTIQDQNAQPLQNQAKILILTVAKLGHIPEAQHWCEALNQSGSRFPDVPTHTLFALNAQVAGRKLTSLPPDTVVFFETTRPGWNQSGGPESLARKATGVAVGFADGRALLVPPDEGAKLRWAP